MPRRVRGLLLGRVFSKLVRQVLSSVSVLLEEATVDQLIDSDSQWWNTSLLDSIFIPSKAQQIKSISVCHSAQKDFFVLASFLDWHVRRCPSKKVRARRPRWKPPDAGFVKENFDEAIFKNLMAAGIGMAIRNEHGEVVAALAEQIPIPDSVFTLETLAARHAVLFVRELGLRNVVFEGDSESSIHAISNRLSLSSSCGHIIHDIFLFASSLQSFSFSHVCR
ncbi:hypothetical protein SO802_007732 [Lithocarpus litseifolius]|uniref:RNase H type-1 domain-containing protein n=1 Tax=Lithocarpus litseifolius TaxID=425828 RepID=A0AAW2DT51_9ROSI